MVASAKVGIKGSTGATGGVSPFLFRLNPTVTTQFGAGRAASGIAIPTATAMTDTDGRPFIRVNSPTNSVAKMLPLLDDDAAQISASGRFRIEMRARWRPLMLTGLSAGGFAFNCDRVGSAVTGYQIANELSGDYQWATYESGVQDGDSLGAVFEENDTLVWGYVAADVWLDTATGYCSYNFETLPGGVADGLQGASRANTTLQTVGGTGVGVWTIGAPGNFDIAELIVWKNERSW